MEPIKKPTNLTELTDDLSDMYCDLRNNSYSFNQAQVINNTAGKIIRAVEVQISFQSLVKTEVDIPYAH